MRCNKYKDDRRVEKVIKRFDAFNILVGNNPVIISAPHNTEHTRNNKPKAGEVNTRSNSCKTF